MQNKTPQDRLDDFFMPLLSCIGYILIMVGAFFLMFLIWWGVMMMIAIL